MQETTLVGGFDLDIFLSKRINPSECVHGDLNGLLNTVAPISI